MHARTRVGTCRLQRYLKKGVVVCLFLLVLLFRKSSLFCGPETYGQEEVPGFSTLFLASPAQDDLHGKLGQRKLFHVPSRHIYLPSFFTLVDFDAAAASNDEEDDAHDFNCTLTSTRPKFHICVYPTQQDIFISAALVSQGVWEPYITKLFQLALKRFPEAAVIDIGANIGYYSLLAAAMGHQVTAIEPSQANVQRMKKGVQLNKAVDKVYLLQNALSKTHHNVSLSENSNNQGGIKVLEGWSGEQHSIKTIVMDDLLHLVHAATAIIKIDIEGYECHGMAASAKLFRRLYVPYILMEWQQMYKHRHQHGTPCPTRVMRQLTDYLVHLGYHAHEVRTGIELNTYRSTSAWQVGDVYWRHRDQPLLIPSL